MDGLDQLGADDITKRTPLTFRRGMLAVAAGAVSALLVPKHSVLAFLNGAALASNAHAVATGDRTWKSAVKRMGRHVVATAGSIAMPGHPAFGYVAGAIAADMLIDDEGGGIIEEWEDYEGVRDTRSPNVTILEGEIVEDSKALVKRRPEMDGLDNLGCENPNYVGFDYSSLLKGAGGLLSGFGGGSSGQMTPQQMQQQMELQKAQQSASTLKTVLIALGVVVGGGGILYAVTK